MKKSIMTVLVLSLMVPTMVLAQEAPAGSEEKVSYGTSAYPSLGEVKCPRLNVRMLPSTESASIIATILKGGAEVTVVSEKNGFFRILPPEGCSVWVFARNIERDGDIGTVLSDNTPVRIDSRINARKVGAVNAGEQVRIMKEHMGWLRIQAPDCVPYYVGSKFVRLTERVDAEKIGLVTEEKTIDAVSDVDGDAKAMEAMEDGRRLAVVQEELLNARRIEELDYNGVIRAYERAAELADTDMVRGQATREAERFRDLQNKLHDIKAQIYANDELIKQHLKMKQMKEIGKPEPINYAFTGYVKMVGPMVNRPGAFRLVMNDNTVCFLKAADGVDAERMIDRMKSHYNDLVGVCGTVVDDVPGWPGSKLVLVTSIEPLSDDAGE